jgi:adenylyl- and sulfurtransferase ThiI
MTSFTFASSKSEINMRSLSHLTRVPSNETTQNLEDIKQLCVSLAKDFAHGDTFKIDVKRVDKSFSFL